jgi:hypothetical protein
LFFFALVRCFSLPLPIVCSPDLEVSLKRRLAGAVPIPSALARFLALVRSCRLQLPFCV